MSGGFRSFEFEQSSEELSERQELSSFRHGSARGVDEEEDPQRSHDNEQEAVRIDEIRSGLRADPFWMYPCTKTPLVPGIVDFYLQNHTPRLPEIDPPDPEQRSLLRYFTYALTSRPLFHAVLAFTAADLVARNLSASVTQHEMLWLKSQALTEINLALQDPANATQDTTIAAVVVMCGFESIWFDLDACSVHMRGARRMIQMRGGLQQLGGDGLFQRMFTYVDHAQGLVTQHHYFADLETWPHEGVDQGGDGFRLNGQPNSSHAELSSFLPRPRGTCLVVLPNELWNAIQTVNAMIKTFTRRSAKQAQQFDWTVLHSEFEAVAVPLETLLANLSDAAEDQSESELDIPSSLSYLVCCAVTSLLIGMWKHMAPHQPSQLSVRQVSLPKVSSVAVRLVSSQDYSGEESVWALFTILSMHQREGSGEERQLLQLLGTNCQQRGILAWKKVQTLLRRYLYFVALQKPYMTQLWKDLAESRTQA